MKLTIDDRTNEEKIIHLRLDEIRLKYEAEAKPYIDMLVAINNTKVRPYFVPYAAALAAGLLGEQQTGEG